MSKRAVALDDKYTQDTGEVYMSSIQALVRLPLMQRQRDLAAGLNTAGFITGYRGSPIGTYDFSLWTASKHLEKNHVKFLPGVNEELAAAAIKGTQWLDRYAKARYDGIFALWYGKHLGIERACEALKVGNYDGSGKHGGVLVVAADDIGGKSSITAAESDHVLIAGMLPVLAPTDTQEYLDFGLYGWAMSRFSGLWVGFKAVTDTIELTRTVDIDVNRVRIVTPTDVEMPPGGLNSRQGDFYPLPMERRVVDFKLPAAKAFTRANGLDRVVFDSDRRRLGIVSSGKAYLDVREALRELGIDESRARQLGIRLYKVGVVWPLETDGILGFGRGHEEVLVIEEKRPVIEEQLTHAFYHVAASDRPRITGKTDEQGRPLKASHGELSVKQAIDIIATRIEALGLVDERLRERIAALRTRRGQVIELPKSNLIRTAYFCSGCPHNTSTRTIEGSMAFTGVGCYGLVPMVMPDRNTEWAAQMGAEGTLWVGLHSFVDVPHAFQNLGDGTYFHSGILAVRQAVAAKVNMTYKLLYNDAVAMTGGQPIDGKLSVEDMANQLYWEGVRPIVIVTDEPEKYPATVSWPQGTTVRHRKELELVQQELQQVKGVSALIYDQTCAAEKRRRRKKNTFPNPPKRVFINQEVCEGCGDCNRKSNCVSVQPLDTEFGRKRKIDQSSCNKDFSCLDGFCPSFVTVHGGAPRKGEAAHSGDELAGFFAELPAPRYAPLGRAIQRADHGYRRHRCAHRGRRARHGGAPRRQGLQRHGHHGHGAEGRLGGHAPALRDVEGAALRYAAVGELGGPHDRLRPGRVHEPAHARTREGRCRPHRSQQRRGADGAVPGQPGPGPGPGQAARDPGRPRRRGPGHCSAGHVDGAEADRRQHRDQRLHDGLRDPEGTAADLARGNRAGDPPEWRCRAGQPARAQLGPAGRV